VLAVLDPRATALELGEPSHEREPDADAGRVVLCGGLTERLEDLQTLLPWNARALVPPRR
jgi:hypothetical protein